MVEGHSVHRVAARFLSKFVGHIFQATSPNGRFTAGAHAISNKKFTDIRAVGKNLFCFFGKNRVVHIHFGMSGRWAIFRSGEAPPTKATTRLVLSNRRLGLESHLSAMTVKYGDTGMYETLRGKLGQDPLDNDADVELLCSRVRSSKKTISRLLMDQAFFAGVGNIYRAEILFVSRMHPEIKGCDLTDEQFHRIWETAVKLMKVGFQTGRITSISKEEGRELGDANRRRYVYNQTKCIMCSSRVSSWKEAGRTVWACLQCQTKKPEMAQAAATVTTKKEKVLDTPHKKRSGRGKRGNGGERSDVFFSHCASEPLEVRQRTPQKLLVRELKQQLQRLGYSTSGTKPLLVERLQRHFDDMAEHTADYDASDAKEDVHGYNKTLRRRKRKLAVDNTKPPPTL